MYFFTFVCYYNEKLMKLNCTLLLIAISTIVFAQNEWKPGYILKSQQDTIWGSLQNKNYNENSHAITFRTDENEQPSTYLPDDIYGYRFKEGKFYVSKYVDSTVGRIFLEYLVNGELDVFFYQDQTGDNHYFVKKDNLPLKELKYKDKFVRKDGIRYLLENNQYKGLLSYYTKETSGIKKDITRLNNVNHKSLVKFAKKYHELSCEDGNCMVYGKNLKRKIFAAIHHGSLFYTGRYSKESNTSQDSYISVKTYFQQFEQSEKLFTFIGVNTFYSKHLYYPYRIGIPVGFEYINPKKGFSLNGSYSLDLASFFIINNLGGGINYKSGNLIIQTKCSLVINLVNFDMVGVSPLFGIIYNIR